jgi:hypothetical protein
MLGVSLNGRVYRQGDACEYLPLGRRAGGAHHIGVINMFYQICFFSPDGRTSRFEIMVDVTNVPVQAKERSMYIIPSIPRRVKQLGFLHVCGSGDSDVLHVDTITAKVQLAPHYSPERRDNLMCALRMWEAV